MSITEVSVGELYRKQLVKTVVDSVDENKSVFLLSYSSVNSPKISELRKDLKKAGASVHVSKNSLARLALKELKQDSLAEKIKGQTAFVWTNDDSVSISKILVKFAKDCDTFSVESGLMDGRVLEESEIKYLSELPSKEALQAQLLGTIQAPLTRFMGALNAKSRELLSILKQLSDQKGGNE